MNLSSHPRKPSDGRAEGSRGAGFSVLCVITAMGCGGAERRLAWLCDGLAATGTRVDLRVLHGPDRFFTLDPRVRTRHFARERSETGAAAARFVARVRWLRREVVDARPDVVLSFIDVANSMTLLATSGLSTPVVVAERAYPPRNRIPRVYRWLRKVLYRRAAAVVVQTAEAARWAEGLTDPGRTQVIPNPVPEPASHRQSVPPIKLPAGPKVIAVGRLAPEKGFDLLIEAFARVGVDRRSRWSLIILGEGPERPVLERLIREHGLADRVHLPGNVHHPETVLESCDLFVLSSRHEGFPNALCEAMACGLPVASFDCPVGPRNIVRDGVDGVLVDAEDVRALAAAIGNLMDDGERRRVLAAAGRDITQRFADSVIFDQWFELLGSVAAAARHR